ncbi:MAG: C26 family cysteine hydrolase domain-containing family [Anaerolineae bacterium]|nr:C26 family cysteine hydrolase domain-containing family [Anaerolineae bacterium]
MILIINNYTDNVHLGDLDMKELGRKAQSISGLPFVVKKFNEVDAQFLKNHPEIKAVISGGTNSKWDELYFDIFEGEFELMREAKVPVLGICAGHQLMAMAYGAGVRRADFGKEERFFQDITIEKDSILTQGIKGTVYAFLYHYCYVTELPEGFELLMSTSKTRIQAMKKIDENKFGVQFHPELDHQAADPFYRARDPKDVNGEVILKNFLSLVMK